MAFSKLGRSRLLIGCILGIGLALLSLWFSVHVWAQEPGGRPVSLDVILLIDNSMSMSRAVAGAPPSDPEELRVRAAKFLVDYLRANAETVGANYRVGVGSFGGVVSDVTPLRLLQDDTVRDSIRAEEIRLTDFRGPLQFALREFEARGFGTGNKMAVILFTDGRPDLTGIPMTEQELGAYFEDLAPLVNELQDGGVSLFVLGIGDAEKDKDNWTQLIPKNHYISIASMAELFDVYHRILAELIGADVSEERVLSAGLSVFIDVDPYTERIVFSFVKSDPDIDVKLLTPAGVVLTPTIEAADAYHSIFVVPDPDEGEWSAFWEGEEEGEVRYWVRRRYPFTIEVELAPPSSAGQPITITARLVRDDGEPFEDPELYLEAEIIQPDDGSATQSLSPIGGGTYSGSYEDVKTDGVHTVTVMAFGDGQPLSVRSLPVTVDVPPSLTVPPPTPQLTSTPTQAPTSGLTRIPSPTAPVPGEEVTPTTPLEAPTLPLVGGWQNLILVVLLVGVVILTWRWWMQREESWRLRQEIVLLKTEEDEATFLEGARQGLRIAEIYSQQGDSSGADSEYKRVLALVEAYEERARAVGSEVARKAWLGRLGLREELEEQRKVLFEGAAKASRLQLTGLADALKVRWARQPELVLEEIYGFIEYGYQPILLDFISQRAVPSEVSKDRTAVVHWAQKVCHTIRNMTMAGDLDDAGLRDSVIRMRKLLANVPMVS